MNQSITVWLMVEEAFMSTHCIFSIRYGSYLLITIFKFISFFIKIFYKNPRWIHGCTLSPLNQGIGDFLLLYFDRDMYLFNFQKPCGVSWYTIPIDLQHLLCYFVSLSFSWPRIQPRIFILKGKPSMKIKTIFIVRLYIQALLLRQ